MASVPALAPIVPAYGFPERARIEGELRALLGGPDECAVTRCMRQAVLAGGSRIRPVLALRVARGCGAREDLAVRAAAAVELMHCASLIVDDLPSMDNARFRRGGLAAHVAFGESTAILAAFGLVALAARAVLEQAVPAEYRDAQRRFACELLRMLDCSALIAGQAMDLELTGERRDRERERINELKTTPLFELAVEAGLAYGRRQNDGSFRQFGRAFGNAFQLADDYLDGDVEDRAALDRELAAARNGCDNSALIELVDYLDARTHEKDRCHR